MAIVRVRPIWKKGQDRPRKTSILKAGDKVMVISGGNSKKRPIKDQVAKIVKFVGDKRDRVVLEGLNLVTRHQKATGPDKPAGKVKKEASVHVSNVMYYVEKLKKPVKLHMNVLADGKRVRGYFNTEGKSKTNKEFVQV
jgi:large subunit ribosomal protein L24